MKRILRTVLFCGLILCAGALQAEVIFDHEVHREDAELDCADCHSPVGGGQPYLGLMPRAELCLDCHDEDVLDTLPARPASHLGDYEHGHQYDVRGDANDCNLCHEESESCTLCHRGENIDVLVHGRNWLYEHPLAVNKGSMDCASCHDQEVDCTWCHVGLGVRPGNHLDPNWTVGGLSSTHAIEGRSDLGNCMLCHDALSPGLCSGCHPGMGE